jgi:TonB-linked SusC/RagA family outer membrane protein
MKKLLLLTVGFCMAILSVSAQNRLLTGIITDADTKEAIIGANVTVKGSKQGTSTNTQGAFTISAAPNAILVITSIGFKALEVPANGNLQNIMLKANTTTLDEVVSIGYATIRRKDVTGSVSSASAKDLKDIPINNAEQALAGRLAGVQVTSAEGSPDATMKITVRGGGSITQDNSPLYIIDGVQVEDGLASISPQDIETIDVLKDASATAIYGARGSNGVVLVTTKSGKSGKVRINYNGFVGVNKLAKKLDVQKPLDYIYYQYERSRVSPSEMISFDNTYGTDYGSLGTRFGNVEFIDWQQDILGRTAYQQTHNLSVSGGSKKITYNASYAYNKQAGTVINTSYQRHLFNFKTDYNVTDKLKVGLSARYAEIQPKGVGTSDPGNASFNRLRAVVKYRPLNTNGLPPDQFDEDLFEETNVGNSLGFVNPFVTDAAEIRNAKNRIINVSGVITYTFDKHFTFRATGGYNYNFNDNRTFYDTLSSTSRQRGGGKIALNLTTRDLININQSNVLTYTLKKKNSDLTILAGQEIFISESDGNNTTRRNVPFGTTYDQAFANFDNYEELTVPTLGYAKNHLLSFFSRANYSYKRRYLFSATMRADGSSKFAQGKQWGYFPSGAFSWRISEEKFMKTNGNPFSDLKLRLSYGLAGNNRIADYRYQNIYILNQVYALNNDVSNLGLQAVSLSNANLKWETTTSKNIGLDIGLFKQRLQITIDAYHNKTNDVLIQAPIPIISGYTSQLQNIATTLNQGLETQISGSIFSNKKFSWTSSFNITFNRNKVLNLTKDLDFFLASSGWGIGQQNDYIIQVGQPVGSIYGFITDGFHKVDDFNYDPITQRYTLKPSVPNPSAVVAAQPGSIKLKDINGDNLITDADRTIMGNANPKFYGGFNQQFTYNNFDASVFVNYQVGSDVFNANKLEFTNGYAPSTNMLTIMNDRWKTVNTDGTLLQQIASNGTVTGQAPSILASVNENARIWLPLVGSSGYLPTSFAVEDGSYLRLNNITVGYTFNKLSWLKKARVNRLRVYATANNLAIITSYSGYDPDVNTRRSTPVTPGVDYSAYPRSRSYFLGLNLSL